MSEHVNTDLIAVPVSEYRDLLLFKAGALDINMRQTQLIDHLKDELEEMEIDRDAALLRNDKLCDELDRKDDEIDRLEAIITGAVEGD